MRPKLCPYNAPKTVAVASPVHVHVGRVQDKIHLPNTLLNIQQTNLF